MHREGLSLKKPQTSALGSTADSMDSSSSDGDAGQPLQSRHRVWQIERRWTPAPGRKAPL